MGQVRIRIGTSKDNEYCIQGPRVSEYHALLLLSPETMEIKDLGSEFGTFFINKDSTELIVEPLKVELETEIIFGVGKKHSIKNILLASWSALPKAFHQGHSYLQNIIPKDVKFVTVAQEVSIKRQRCPHCMAVIDSLRSEKCPFCERRLK